MISSLSIRPNCQRLIALILTAAALSGLPSCSPKSSPTDKNPTVWYVNPIAGSDRHSGASESSAWKTFQPLNTTALGAGDEVLVFPGQHSHSLVPQASGTRLAPVRIRFQPGVHEFGAEQATRRSYFISNSCADPEKPMPIGILIKDCQHLVLSGGGLEGETRTTLLMAGRMTHFINDHSENIRYQQMTFDLKRPTVSEFRVTAGGASWSDIAIAQGSTCELRDGRLIWTGDLGSGTPLMQQAIPAEGRAWRTRFSNNPLDQASRIEAIGEHGYRLHFEDREPLQVGHQFQFRNGHRDVVGAHNVRSQDIVIEDVDFHAFAGMGIISQFCENLTYRRVRVVPPENTLRTCPAWADAFHFSGCRGDILVQSCTFSGLQDDPVNVHGTHLRIVDQPEPNQLLVRFIHKQTYGFAAFQPGDKIAVIHSPTLREHDGNPRRTVTNLKRITDRDWLLTLDGEAPHFEENDVVDNLTWYPDLMIRDCHVDMCPTRGFLVTTRGKAMIAGNTLKRCRMPGVLIENDASGWFESGPIRDLMIADNTFIGCDIRIHPRAKTGNDPVHTNIRILNNTFKEGAGIDAHHTSGLVIQGNHSDDGELKVVLDPESTSAVIRDND